MRWDQEHWALRSEGWHAWSREHADDDDGAAVETHKPAFLAGFDLAAREAAERIMVLFGEHWTDPEFVAAVVDEFGLSPRGRHR